MFPYTMIMDDKRRATSSKTDAVIALLRRAEFLAEA
jgi:hypothetical protein